MKAQKKWILGLSVITILCFILLIGCGGSGNNASQPADTKGAEATNEGTEKAAQSTEKQKIVLGYLVGDQLHQYALPIALEKGYFAEEGIELELKEFQSGGMVTQFFNELDVALVGANPVIIGKAQGLDMVVFQSLNHGGSSLVVDPSIANISDLNDKEVATPGVAAIQHNIFTMLEKQNNITAKKLTAKVTDMPVFAQKGEIKGAIAWEPWPTIIMETAGWNRLLSSNDLMENQQCCLWVTSRKFMEEHPDIIEKLVRINIKATKYVRSYPDEAIKILAKYASREESTVEKAMANLIYPWPPKINEASTKKMIENLMSQELIDPKAVKPDVDTWYKELVDESVLDKMINEGYVDKVEKEGVPK